MGKYFPILGDMFMLSRSYASRLPHSGREGGVLDLSKYIKQHYISTVYLDHFPHEEGAFQLLHRVAAKEYEEAIKGPKENEKQEYKEAGNASTADKKKGGSFATGPLRDLAILTGGVTSGIFNSRAKALKASTLVAQQQIWRDEGYSIEYIGNLLLDPIGSKLMRRIVKCTLQAREPLPATRIDWLEKFVFGSPKFR
jgi:hypothetical protein